jgi:hypothetical protein
MNLISYSKYCLLPLVFAVFSSRAFSQKKKQKEITPAKIQTLWITHNPLTWIEPEIPVSLTILYKKTNRLAFALDAGVFIARQAYEGGDNNFQPYSGFRLKPEVRFYPAGEKYGPTGFYLSVQGLIKQTGWKKEEWRSPDDPAGFQRLVSYTEKKNVWGLNFLMGGEFFTDKQERFQVEVYGGIGIRTKRFSADGLPVGFTRSYENRGDDDFVDNSFSIYRNGIFYSISLGIKIGVRIN